ncbi:MAG: phosphoribosylglycinamide formyltransferase [Bacteroidetes bacterium]|nr:phosphoribosylglycinamide formyltransferase [Bacteroidota bacterium]MDA1119244.1 phosphoribosylglycinamide formyltransferase [Bacteroidota bacterium]
MNRVAVFASGNGTNAEEIFKYFEGHQSIEIEVLLCNNPKAGVIQRAENWKVPVVIFSRDDLVNSSKILEELKSHEVDWIALAGFLWLLPPTLVHEFPGRIINIHPSLLPKYGGKGMYGSRVHEAAIASGDKESGITIHMVDEEYDKGKIIFQAHCNIAPQDSADTLAQKIHKLEYNHYPEVIEKYILHGCEPA